MEITSNKNSRLKCIYCKSGTITKNGKDENDNQRYKCDSPKCGKTFTYKSIEHPNIRRDKRIAVHLLLLGYTVPEIAEKLKVESSVITLWQKKYLPKLNDLVNKGKLIEVNYAVNYISALDTGKRPERINKNKSSFKKPHPRTTTRKKL